jgi:hypothetical protein
MKRPYLYVWLAMALGGCASQPQVAPAVPVTVSVPTPVPCKVALPQAPGWDVDALPLGSDIWDQMAALRAERLQRIGYEGELLSAIQACQ